MSAQELITEHLDLWTEAVTKKSTSGRGNNRKTELTGIKKLRELILELAVRGMLVEQDEGDEPAQELIAKLSAAKAELTREEILKKSRILPDISDEEAHTPLPSGWFLTRLGNAYDIRDGTHDSPMYQLSGYPLITSKNLSSGELSFDDVKLISESDHQKIQERSKVSKGDILFAMIGSIGNPVIVNTDREFSIKNVALFKYYSNKLSNPSFLKLFLENAAENLKQQAAGGVQPFVTLGKLRNWLIPLPPLEEQHRIVQKVDELMTLCDQLEQQTSDQLAAHESLVDTLLGTLTQSENATELADNWARLATHFDTLFTTEQSIDKLKQSILQLAVMGRLVEQDAGDEPAEQLIERLAAQKAEIGNEKRRVSKTPKIESSESQAFQIPSTWAWVPLQQTGFTSTGKTPSTKVANFFSGDIPFIGPGQVTVTGKITMSEKFLSEEGILHSEEALPDDILTVCIGGSIGKTARVTERCGFNQQLNKIRPVIVEPSYLLTA